MSAGIRIEFDEVDANFTIVPNQVIYNRALKTDIRFLWVYLRSHRSGYVLGYRQMKADLDWSEVTLRKNLNTLQDAGLVKLTQTRIGARNGHLLISILLGNKPILQTTDSEGSTFEGSKSEGLNNTKETNKTKESTTLAQDKPERSLVDVQFDKFWANYPRSVDKVAARKAFAKAAAKNDADMIIEAAKKFSEDPNLPTKDFIKHPATWLNAGSWDNEPFPEREKPKPEVDPYLGRLMIDSD